MNRELRRLSQKEEKRRRQQGPQRPKRERVGIRQFLREVRQEMRRVAWPSRQELFTFSVVTIITTLFLTAITFGMDLLFKQTVLALVERIAS